MDRRMTDVPDSGERDQAIPEDQFLRILADSPEQKAFFAFYEVAPSDAARWKRRHCTALVELAHEFETFLDEFHARSNRRFYSFGELVASVRNVADAAHVLNHLDIRFSQYDVRFGATDAEHRDRMWQFRAELSAAIRFANESLVRLLQAVREEGKSFGLAAPELTPIGGHVPEDRARVHLPHDLDREEVETKGGAVAVLLHGVLQGAERVQQLRDRLPRGGYDAMRQFVRDHFSEVEARKYTTGVHNLQSAYDTYVKPTRLSVEIPELRTFRGHVSLALHLFEVASHLVHFYERHEGEELRGITKDRIAKLVPREQVLHHVVQFAARNAADVVLRVVPLAQALLPRLAPQQTIELELPEGVTLHARPLSLIFGVVRHHKVPVEIVVEGKSTSAGSIMGLIMFVGRFPGARKVAFRGESAPLEHLKMLFAAGLGERGFDGFPKALGYLRPT
jgi:phosphotransferase system HPr-like phosphotransfer protein